MTAEKPITVFAFHPAGGSSAFFSSWRRVSRGIVVRPVDLPTRADYLSVGFLDSLAEETREMMQCPHVFYGHSMGALVAYRLAARRVRLGFPGPRKLIIGAAAAPHLQTGIHGLYKLADEDLVSWIKQLAPLPLSYRSPYLRAAALDRLRADLRTCELLSSGAGPTPLDCPLDILIGSEDPLVSVSAAAGWSSYTRAEFTMRTLSGGHFFPRDTGSGFTDAVWDLLKVLDRAS
ncbi:thioesterase II family protein [Streptomyces sp. cg2]|uniref:thioesterase II family protein n=1 Tax=Streptomyces sp. cg2 TaxID=3238799 RepID=UPI0034E1AE23